MRVVSIDFETANNHPASVCSVGLSCLEDGCVEEVYESYIRPQHPYDHFVERNIMIHGIHPEDVEDAPDFSQVLAAMRPWFENSIVCAHNAAFDMGCLKAACRAAGEKIPSFRYFDTLALSRVMYPQMDHHRLNDMCSYLNIELDHHRASSDAYGCLMIVLTTMNLTGSYDIEELLKELRIPLKLL